MEQKPGARVDSREWRFRVLESSESASTQPDLSSTSGLQTAELVLLIGLRLERSPDTLIAAEHWQRCKVGGAAAPIKSLQQVLEVACDKPFVTNITDEPILSDDEKRILWAVSSIQNGRPIEAFDIFISCLPGVAVRIALNFTRTLANTFVGAGFYLPDRFWSVKGLSVHRSLRAPASTCRGVRYSFH